MHDEASWESLRSRSERQQRDLQAMKEKTTWVLLADGARARIVRQINLKDEEQVEDLVFEIDHKQLGEIMSDRPGRSFASEGKRRSALEYHSEPEKDQEARFAETLVAELEQRFLAHEFQRLAIVAEPRMLGVLRRKLSPTLQPTVVVEVAKDLTKVPRQELTAAIGQLGIK
ncbi:host attachment protein [Pseudaminobacter sp. NGMCC 1.201702]